MSAFAFARSVADSHLFPRADQRVKAIGQLLIPVLFSRYAVFAWVSLSKGRHVCSAPNAGGIVVMDRDKWGMAARFHGDFHTYFILITLLVTPLRALLNEPQLIRFRRMLILFALPTDSCIS